MAAIRAGTVIFDIRANTKAYEAAMGRVATTTTAAANAIAKLQRDAARLAGVADGVSAGVAAGSQQAEQRRENDEDRRANKRSSQRTQEASGVRHVSGAYVGLAQAKDRDAQATSRQERAERNLAATRRREQAALWGAGPLPPPSGARTYNRNALGQFTAGGPIGPNINPYLLANRQRSIPPGYGGPPGFNPRGYPGSADRRLVPFIPISSSRAWFSWGGGVPPSGGFPPIPGPPDIIPWVGSALGGAPRPTPRPINAASATYGAAINAYLASRRIPAPGGALPAPLFLPSPLAATAFNPLVTAAPRSATRPPTHGVLSHTPNLVRNYRNRISFDPDDAWGDLEGQRRALLRRFRLAGREAQHPGYSAAYASEQLISQYYRDLREFRRRGSYPDPDADPKLRQRIAREPPPPRFRPIQTIWGGRLVPTRQIQFGDSAFAAGPYSLLPNGYFGNRAPFDATRAAQHRLIPGVQSVLTPGYFTGSGRGGGVNLGGIGADGAFSQVPLGARIYGAGTPVSAGHIAAGPYTLLPYSYYGAHTRQPLGARIYGPGVPVAAGQIAEGPFTFLPRDYYPRVTPPPVSGGAPVREGPRRLPRLSDIDLEERARQRARIDERIGRRGVGGRGAGGFGVAPGGVGGASLLAGGFIGFTVLRAAGAALRKYADEWNAANRAAVAAEVSINRALRVATGSGTQLAATATALGEITRALTRQGIGFDAAGVEDLASAAGVGFRANGLTNDEATSALENFSKVFNEVYLNQEAYERLLQDAPDLVRRVAEEYRGWGLTLEQFNGAVRTGQIDTVHFAEAVQKVGQAIEREAVTPTQHMREAAANLHTALTVGIGRDFENLFSGGALADAIDGVSASIHTLSQEGGGLSKALAPAIDLLATVLNFAGGTPNRLANTLNIGSRVTSATIGGFGANILGRVSSSGLGTAASILLKLVPQLRAFSTAIEGALVFLPRFSTLIGTIAGFFLPELANAPPSRIDYLVQADDAREQIRRIRGQIGEAQIRQASIASELQYEIDNPVQNTPANPLAEFQRARRIRNLQIEQQGGQIPGQATRASDSLETLNRELERWTKRLNDAEAAVRKLDEETGRAYRARFENRRATRFIDRFVDEREADRLLDLNDPRGALAGRTITPVVPPEDALEKHYQRQDELHKAQVESYRRMQELQTEIAERENRKRVQIAEWAGSTVEEVLVLGLTGPLGAVDDLSDAFRRLGIDVLQSLLRITVAESLGNSLRSGFLSWLQGYGWNPNSSRGSTAASTATVPGGHRGVDGRAYGGPVMRGVSYVVGERGPELYTPFSDGRITPNHQSGFGGSGGERAVFNINVSGSDRQTLELGIQNAKPEIAQYVMSLLDARGRPTMRPA